MNYLMDFFKGLIIGISAIAPGVSGGALAVIFGIYEKVTDALAHLFTDFKKKVIFFLPIGLGAAVGFFSFSRVISFLYTNYQWGVKYLFMGLMIGTLPSVFKQANQQGFRKLYFIPFSTALLITVALTFLENQSISSSSGEASFMLLVICGGILGIGTMVPGISASFVLMYLGTYEILLEGISRLDFTVLFPAGIGFVVSVILFAKLISMLFKKAYGLTYYTVLGFAIGSIIAIFPGIELNLKLLIYLVVFFAGFNISYWLSKFEH